MKARKTVLKEITRLQRVIAAEKRHEIRTGGPVSRKCDEAYAMMTALVWTTYGRCSWTPAKALKEREERV